MKYTKLSPAFMFAVVTALGGIVLSNGSPAGQLTSEETRGQQIYLRGTSPSGNEIIAALGKEGTEVPGSVLSCVNCHGHDGLGKPEGGVTPSNINWETLTRPYEATAAGGRTHPPYTERTLKRAIAMGLDPAGNNLHVAMPRYRMSHQDMADLIAYLKRLGKILDPGVSETVIRVGVVLPPSQMGQAGPAVKSVLTAYFDRINKDGGIYGRRLELVPIQSPDRPEERADSVRASLEQQPVFAFTGTFMAGAEAAMADLFREKELPSVGAFAFFPSVDFPLNRYVFYLYSGLADQGRALAALAEKKAAGTNARTAIVFPEGEALRKVAEAIENHCNRLGWDSVEKVPAETTSTASLVSGLSAKKIEVVFFLGPSVIETAFLRDAAQLGWKPLFLVPGSLASREIFDAPAAFEGRIFMAFPTLPSDHTLEGALEYKKLVETHELPSSHFASQLTALSSATLLVEALRRSGREVSRQKLIEVLEKLYQYKTGLTPPITYGPNRRVGSTGAHVVSVDLVKKTFVPVEWIEPE